MKRTPSGPEAVVWRGTWGALVVLYKEVNIERSPGGDVDLLCGEGMGDVLEVRGESVSSSKTSIAMKDHVRSHHLALPAVQG